MEGYYPPHYPGALPSAVTGFIASQLLSGTIDYTSLPRLTVPPPARRMQLSRATDSLLHDRRRVAWIYQYLLERPPKGKPGDKEMRKVLLDLRQHVDNRGTYVSHERVLKWSHLIKRAEFSLLMEYARCYPTWKLRSPSSSLTLLSSHLAGMMRTLWL